MNIKQPLMQKIRFCVTAAILYALSVTGVVVAIRPAYSPVQHVSTLSGAELFKAASVKPNFSLVVGRPIRIVIHSVYVYQPNQYVDVPIDQGYYSVASGTWTLSGYHAQYDMSSSPANNFGGETFIYGHNNDFVFGAFRHHPPRVGAEALVYTENGHIFAYKFERSQRLSPSDVSILNYHGAPMLLVQTCTGSFNEWRTMYWFSFEQVVR